MILFKFENNIGKTIKISSHLKITVISEYMICKESLFGYRDSKHHLPMNLTYAANGIWHVTNSKITMIKNRHAMDLSIKDAMVAILRANLLQVELW